MRAFAVPKANDRTQNSGAHRDKRYYIPVLSVDLFGKIYETTRWSFSHFILNDFEEPMEVGSVFHGCLTFLNRQSFGLFEAKVAKVDSARKMVGCEFSWIAREGFALLEYMNSLRPEDQPDRGEPVRISIAYPTVNWSLSGMLLGGFLGNMKPNETVRGMIRSEKTHEAGVFTANSVRTNLEKKTLALKFTSLSPELFDMLEAAIKKHPSE